MILLAETAKHLSLWQDYLRTQFDFAHLFSEAGFEFASGVVAYPAFRWLWKRALKRHDEEVHSEELTDEEIKKLRALIDD